MNPANLADMLRDTAGSIGHRAAIDLLAAQGHWMTDMAERPDEMAVAIGVEDGTPWAYVDWTALADRCRNGELIGSTGEYAVLQVACALADEPMPLGGLTSLDASNVRLVLAAVAKAAGRSEVLQP